ncbi:MAG: beta-N-acetylhexosaminidase [Bacteroidales bacterium]|nr:beta-N-acetylhexosaminidase [Candidatus Cryptobacteroides aphodequi]
MKHLNIVLAAVAAICASACASKSESNPVTIGIVPAPTKLEVVEGKFVSAENASKVTTRINTSLAEEEYTLTIGRRGVEIAGGSETGVFWAIQTLEQIKVQCPADSIPCLKVIDRPAFPYRGSHLDCSRHFFSVDEVKGWIDMMAIHKLNYFHWHLTDDQGWRLEIKKYPLLTEIGSVRAQTKVGHYNDKAQGYDNTPYGGFYTQEEAREIVEYAAERHIQVIPEIEMPGHAVAAVTAYPWLGCSGKQVKVRETWGISDEVFCVSKNEVLDFIKDVIDEVCDIFPCEYFNIGGDECPTTEWEKCPSCQAYMKEHGIDTARGLQYDFTAKVEQYVLSKGRKMLGWQELADGCSDASTTILAWLGAEAGIKAAAKGMHTVMCPSQWCYLDYYQTREREKREPLAIGGYLPLSSVYSFDPLEGIPAEQHHFVRGVQGNVWCEYIPTMSHAQHMALPRLAAIAEIGWSGSEGKTSFDCFKARLTKGLVPVYQARGYNYATYEWE